MILRAWVEEGTGRSLRVRITRVSDNRPDQPETTVLATVDAVSVLVRAWLEMMLQDVAG